MKTQANAWRASRFLRTAIPVLALMALGVPATLFAQDTPEEAAALEAAEAWLAIVDAGEYERSWEEAASTFQSALTAAEWAQRVGAVETQLGDREIDRVFVETQPMTDPPGAPAGDYIAVIYSSGFQMLDPAREVVSVVMEDGEWKAVGYVVVPEQ